MPRIVKLVDVLGLVGDICVFGRGQPCGLLEAGLPQEELEQTKQSEQELMRMLEEARYPRFG